MNRKRADNFERSKLTARIVGAAKTPKQRTGWRAYDQGDSIASLAAKGPGPRGSEIDAPVMGNVASPGAGAAAWRMLGPRRDKREKR